MSEGEPCQVLKRNQKRTVLLAREGLRTVVVKRFHAPGAFDRWRDRARAGRERRALRRLGELGLPVARPLAIRRRAGRWELVLEHLAGADLGALLAGSAPWPVAPGLVAARLGRLLADIVGRGIALPDLHAGNVRIDPDGRPWLLDVTRVERRDPSALELELAGLAAGVRESAPGSFRARFLVALVAADAGARAALEPLARSVEALERSARRLRRERIAGRVARWWRESGDTRAFSIAGREGWASRAFDDRALEERLATSGAAAAFGLELVRGPAHRERWEHAARLAMHGLPGPTPVCVVTRPEPCAVLAWPEGSDRLEALWSRSTAPDRVLLAHEAGSVLGALDDRGLALVPEGGSGLLATPRGEVRLGPGRLVPMQRSDLAGQLACLFETLAPAPSRAARAACAERFVRAHRGTAAERRRLLAERWDA